MRAIFISYRRDDAEGQAGRLFDDLAKRFGKNAVFMDVTGIGVGRDFRMAIEEQVASCGVLLAMIGKAWLDARDESGRRRLDDPADFVRLETASALKRDIPVVPVLVQGAHMPRPEQLPDDLAALAYRNGVELTHARWDSDVEVLINALRSYVQMDTSKAPRPTRRWATLSVGLLIILFLVLAGYRLYDSVHSIEGDRLAQAEQTKQPTGTRAEQNGQKETSAEQHKQPPENVTPIPSYPMTCRGGPLSVSTFPGADVRITFQRGPGPVMSGLAPGQCTWSDRAIGPKEPNVICDDPTNAAKYLGLLGSDRYVILHVFNDNGTCMRVTGVGP